MALIKCEECGNEISEEAKTCPKCGRRVKKIISKCKMIAILILLVLIVSILMGAITIAKNNNEINKYKKEAISIIEDYKEKKIEKEKAAQELTMISINAKKESDKIEGKDKAISNKKAQKLDRMALIIYSISEDIRMEENSEEIEEQIEELKRIK